MSSPEADVGAADGSRASLDSSTWQQAGDAETGSLHGLGFEQQDKVQNLENKLHEEASHRKKAESDAARWEAQAKEAGVKVVELEAMTANLENDVQWWKQSCENAKEEANAVRQQVVEEERLKTSAQVACSELERRLQFWKDKAAQSRTIEDEGLPSQVAARRLQAEAQREKRLKEEWQKEAEKWKRFAKEEEEFGRLKSEQMASLQEHIQMMSGDSQLAEEDTVSCLDLPLLAVRPKSWPQLRAALTSKTRKVCNNKIVWKMVSSILVIFCVAILGHLYLEQDKEENLQTQLNHSKDKEENLQTQLNHSKEEAEIAERFQKMGTIGGTGEMRISLEWAGDYDLDLYVKPPGGAAEINYLNPRSAEGRHSGDCQGSTSGNCDENVFFPEPPPGRYHVSVYCIGYAPHWTLNVTRGDNEVIRRGICSDGGGSSFFFCVGSTYIAGVLENVVNTLGDSHC